MTSSVAVVLGGYVNGYSIVRELHSLKVPNIWLFDYGRSLTRFSRRLCGVSTINRTPESLLAAILSLRQRFSYLVLYPTNDLELELLKEIRSEIESFCFLPFNSTNL